LVVALVKFFTWIYIGCRGSLEVKIFYFPQYLCKGGWVPRVLTVLPKFLKFLFILFIFI
jgi:hypothetical protein